MRKTTKPSADELAGAAAVRLQIATGWRTTASGGRITARITPDEANAAAKKYETQEATPDAIAAAARLYALAWPASAEGDLVEMRLRPVVARQLADILTDDDDGGAA